MSQLMVEKRAGNRGARQQSLSRRTAKAVFALKRSGYPCSFLVPFASKTRITFSRDVVEKHSPYLNGIAPLVFSVSCMLLLRRLCLTYPHKLGGERFHSRLQVGLLRR